MTFEMKFNHGDEVMVYDQYNSYLYRGKIHGRAPTNAGERYDIQPSGTYSLSERMHSIPKERLRLASAPVLVVSSSVQIGI